MCQFCEISVAFKRDASVSDRVKHEHRSRIIPDKVELFKKNILYKLYIYGIGLLMVNDIKRQLQNVESNSKKQATT